MKLVLAQLGLFWQPSFSDEYFGREALSLKPDLKQSEEYLSLGEKVDLLF